MARRRYALGRSPNKPRRLKPLNADSKSFKGQLFSRQMQAVVHNVFKYLRREKLHGGPLRPVSQLNKRVAEAVGIGINKVTDIKKKGASGENFTTPGKKRRMRRSKRDVDDFTKCAIRNLIYELCRKRRHFTIRSLLGMIRSRGIDFYGGHETLRKVLYDLGFKFKKKNGTRFLVEQPRIVLLRMEFLRRFKKAHTEGKKYFVYLDETWVMQRGSGQGFAWQDDDIRSCPVRHTSSGGRYIVLHAGGREGFVNGAGKVWSSSKKPQPGDDYHGDMDGRIMKLWFTQDFLPNLPRPSIIVMDNAPYHSCQEEDEKQPNSNSTKDKIKAWLDKQGISYDPEMLKKELLALAKLNKKPKHYILESLLFGTEHEILRLPPYHAFFNPIELAWGLVKRYFESHVGRDQDYSIESMIKIFEEALASVTPEVWRKICDKVEKRILEAYEAEKLNEDNEGFQMIINIGKDSDDEDEDEDADGDWETVSRVERVGEAEEQDVDDPDPVMDVPPTTRRKLTRVELACGMAFDEVLPSTSSSDSQGKSKVPRRSLFPKNVPCPVTRQDNSQSALPDVDPDFTSKSAGVFFSSVCQSVSLSWSLIPNRLISQQEIDSAVSSIENEGSVSNLQGDLEVDVALQRNTALSLTHSNRDDEEHLSQCHTSPDKASTACGANFTSVSSDHVDVKGDDLNSLSHPNFPSEKASTACGAVGTSVSRLYIDVNEDDLKSLLPHNFPSEQVIDFYFKLIAAKYSSIDLEVEALPCNLLKSLTLETGTEDFLSIQGNIEDWKILMFPVHLKSFWCLYVVMPKLKKIAFFNPPDDECDGCLPVIVRFLESEMQRLKEQAMDWRGWTVEAIQGNHKDCNMEDYAVLVCCYARCLLECRSCSLDITAIPEIRQQIRDEVLASCLSDLQFRTQLVVPFERKPRSDMKCGNILISGTSNGISLERALQIMLADNTGDEGTHSITLYPQFSPQSISDEAPLANNITMPNGRCVEEHQLCKTPTIAKGPSHEPCETVTISSASDSESDSEAWVPATESIEEVLLRPEECKVVSHGGYLIKVRDLKTLRPSVWLNCEIVNAYMSLVAEGSPMNVSTLDSNFYTRYVEGGYALVKKWMRKVDIFNVDLVLIPVHIVNHWVLITCDNRNHTVTKYDSLGNPSTTEVQKMLQALKEEHLTRKRKALPGTWFAGNAEGIPLQAGNTDECGVFVCTFAKTIALQCDFWTFELENTAEIRKQMMREIQTRKLLPLTQFPVEQSVLRPQGIKPILPVPYVLKKLPSATLIQSGRLHQRMDVFPPDRRNAQCTAIAAGAIVAYSQVRRPFTVKEMDIILLAGDELYIYCRTSRNAVEDQWLDPDDLPKSIEFLGLKRKLKVEHVGGGTYKRKDLWEVLCDTINLGMTPSLHPPKGEFHGFLFIGRAKTVSFWPGPEGQFFMYNSHCVSKENAVEVCSERGAARLFSCETAVSLSKLLLTDAESDNNVWGVIRLVFTF